MAAQVKDNSHKEFSAGIERFIIDLFN